MSSFYFFFFFKEEFEVGVLVIFPILQNNFWVWFLKQNGRWVVPSLLHSRQCLIFRLPAFPTWGYWKRPLSKFPKLGSIFFLIFVMVQGVFLVGLQVILIYLWRLPSFLLDLDPAEVSWDWILGTWWEVVFMPATLLVEVTPLCWWAPLKKSQWIFLLSFSSNNRYCWVCAIATNNPKSVVQIPKSSKLLHSLTCD